VCGIAGFISQRRGGTSDQLALAARAMANAIAHRGPDDEGVWTDSNAGVVLAHRRLSIVDLSQEGHQPMASATGRFVTVFNGEIYNYAELREELDRAAGSPRWRGHSDTEVLLAACEMWGVEEAIRRSNGMFALAIWDAVERVLTLVRDRLGEKPLYYGWHGGVLLFGSELKAIEAYPGFHGEVDGRAVSAFLRLAYIPAPLSIYKGIQKLEPGGIVRVPASGTPGSERRACYWRVPYPEASPQMDAESAVDRLHELLKSAVKSRMHADVPLGAFLSGGIDSSTVAALMQDSGMGTVRTYSIGFDDRQHNEAVHAAAVARVLGTQHEELYVTAKDALEVVPRLSSLYDEPFADSSQIPTYLLSKLTRRHVTVALSGDAGDELFGGYVRYLRARRLLRFHAAVPGPARRLLASGLSSLAGPLWDSLSAFAPRSAAVVLSSDRLAKLAKVMQVDGHREMYGSLVAQWEEPQCIAPQLPTWPTALDDESLARKVEDPLDWMMYLDQITYLPDDILAKVDRASMAVALEARVPFLDHRVVEFAAQLPVSLKIKNGCGKWVLRQVLHRYVDRTLVERPKQGFAIPVAAWLRGALREWAEDLLSESALARSGLLDPRPIRAAWAAHLSRRQNHHYRLWVILMLQSWLRRVGAGRV
jgi:asparagine synthase (glutamine-hydrolysing)